MSLSTLVRRSALLGLLLGLVPGAGAQQRQAAPVDSPFLTAPPVESAVDKLLAPEPSFGTAPAASLLRTGGPDDAGYSFTDSSEPGGPTFSWIDISAGSATPGTAVTISSLDDGVSSAVTLPFAFRFYGVNYSSVRVGSNGNLQFGTTTSTTAANVTMPNTATPNQMIAAYWDDLIFTTTRSAAASIRTRNMGDGRFVISWISGQHYYPSSGNTSSISFQAILYDTGDIRLQYNTINLGNATESSSILTAPVVTAGTEGSGATGQGLLVNFATGYFTSGLAVQITAPPPPPPDVTFGSAAMSAQNVGTVYANNSSFWFGSRSTVVINGTNGTLPMTSATFDLSGSTDPTDVVEARLYYTGSSVTAPSLASPQFGTPVLNPGSSVTFTGTQPLGAGNHNFWLVLRLANGTPGAVISNAFTSVTIDGTAQTPSPTTLGNVLTLGAGPSNDALVNARRVTGTPPYSNASGPSAGASPEVGEAPASCTFNSPANDNGQSMWWRYTPSVDGTATFTSTGYDTIQAIYTGTGFPLTEVECADDQAAGTPESSTLSVTAGTTYWFRVTGYTSANGTATVTISGPEPVADDEFVFSRPTAGQIFRIGKPLKPIWTSAPIIAASTVTVSLCAVEGSCDAPHYTGPNLVQPDFLDARLIIPPSTVPGSYTLRACVAGDPNNCVDSPVFSIVDPTNVFVITSPAQAASGTDATIEWTSPPTDPPTDVTLTVSSRGGETTYATLTTANDGSETVTIPPVPNGSYLLTVCPSSGPDPTCGKRVVVVRPLVVTEPDGSLVWTPGSTQTVSWSTAACGSGTATADIYLRRSSGGKTLLADDTDCDDTEDITVPAGAADASDYFVQVQVFDGGSRVATGNSATFSVGTPIRVAGTSRVDAPLVSGTADAIVRVATPGLADGSEVSVSAGRLVLGTGIVRAGEAEVALFGMVADPMLMASGLTAEEAMEIVEAGTELRVTTWSAAGEAPLELGRITDADGREVAALTFEIGTEYVVAAKGATTTTADVFTLDRVSPNPTSGAASVRFTLAESQAVRVTVYDLLGREVATLFDGTATAGANAVGVPALTAGVYVVRVATPSTSATTRFTVVR